MVDFLEKLCTSQDQKQWLAMVRSFNILIWATTSDLESRGTAEEDLRRKVTAMPAALRNSMDTTNTAACEDPNLHRNMTRLAAKFREAFQSISENLSTVVTRVAKSYAELVAACAMYEQICRGAAGGKSWAHGQKDGEKILDVYTRTLAKVNKQQLEQGAMKVNQACLGRVSDPLYLRIPHKQDA